ncbi:protein kinase domain protein [Ichthyophthirius multifiliis]|uniref:non-specific serine/threonine protein kinase n=1 Tax=Ichthyophthirius multifiliis TaxID=5932 RepID=G0QLH5_ICHMU|nr:protein kinase domain protein [Ichthyophthirius multifiliis]EGR33931.1 protein kinase domain protein [Ichthyophthirius multifiliis]|eukprot:XP_004039235.1 protein kinase domain protein [Ichthyophthirius multifiliis]
MSQLSHFKIIKPLGEGTFGTVYLVNRIQDQKQYAMKKVKMMCLSTREQENALNEVRILASLKSENIIRYKNAFIDNPTQTLCIIMEFATKGDLQKQISEHMKRNDYFDEKSIWKYASDILKGLKILHSSKILHRDLKCANIFISNSDSLKLGDLNVSKVQKRDFAYTQTGTPYYTAPEVWKNKPYDSKCDIWSFGCVLYEISTFEPPFKGISIEDLYKKIVKGAFIPINSQKYSSELQNFISVCLKVDPKQRENVDNLLKNKNIAKYMNIEDTKDFVTQSPGGHCQIKIGGDYNYFQDKEIQQNQFQIMIYGSYSD